MTWVLGRIIAVLLVGGGGLRGAEGPRTVASFSEAADSRNNMCVPLQLKDGRIVAVSIARNGDVQSMVGRFSSGRGERWGEPQMLFRFARETGGFGYYDAMVDRDGEIHIFYLNDRNTGLILPKIGEGPGKPGDALDIWHVRSRQGVRRWEAPKRIFEGRAGDLLSSIQLRSGRLLLPISYRTARSWAERGTDFLAFSYAGSYSSSALYSDDGGNTWTASPDELTVPVPTISAYGGVEPVAIELKDGRVRMLIRTQMGRFYETFSTDGSRWSPARPSTIRSSEAPAGLLRLRDGRILLFVNQCQRSSYAFGGRQVLHAALSADDGVTWSGFREVARDHARGQPPPPRGDFGIAYPFPALLDSGDVLFSNWVQTGPARTITRFDPRWLDETSQRTDFSTGIDDWSVFGTRGAEVRAHPDREGRKVLAVGRADAAWPPGGAVWNFPMARAGKLTLRVRAQAGYGGAVLGLADHFSPPFDAEDVLHNVYTLTWGPGSLKGAWQTVEIAWDGSGMCRVRMDGRESARLQASRVHDGVNYLRIRSTATAPDGGLLIEQVEMNSVSAPKAGELRGRRVESGPFGGAPLRPR